MSSAADPDNRFAPPTAHVEDVVATGLVLGGRGARLGAAIIDGLIQGGIFFLLLWLFTDRFLPAPGRAFLTMLLQVAGGFVLFLLLQGYLLATRGQTIGKKLVGLRIVRADGSQAGAGRLIGLRYGIGFVVMAIPVIGNIYALVDSLLIFRATRQCVHDNIADTIVIKA